jgi:plastocyanin
MKNNQPRFVISALVFTIMALFTPMLAAVTTHDVAVINNRFSPNDLTIEVGDTVRWTNSAARTHDVTADDGSFASQTSSSFEFSLVFSSIEEILYHCTVHSSAGQNINTNMNGRLNVVAVGVSTDVSIESVDATNGAYKAGKDVSIKATLKNLGDADSGMFNVDFYASTNDTITTGDTLLGSKNISNIATGATENINESFTLPESLTAGDYFIGAIHDLDDDDADNNTNVDETTIYVFTVFTLNAGLNDAWYNPVTDGQGFFIVIFPELGFVTLAWFTYDTELPPMDAMANLGDPGHRWLTALGEIDGDQSEMTIYITSEGLFDTPPDEALPRVEDGTIVLKFNSCNEATASYDIISIDAQGVVPLQRVAIDNVVLCEELLRASQQTP